jgi:hypothetical protein
VTLLSPPRVGPALTAGGLLLAGLGALAGARGPWPLVALGALSVVVGVLLALVGLGLRARLSGAGRYEIEAELDAKLMAAVRRSGAGTCDEASTPCDSCDLGCAPRIHP